MAVLTPRGNIQLVEGSRTQNCKEFLVREGVLGDSRIRITTAPLFDGKEDGCFDAFAGDDLGALALDAVEDLGELGGGLLEGPGLHDRYPLQMPDLG